MITELDIVYAQRLRGLRLTNGIKQETAFSMLGLNTQQEYSKLENGKINFTDDLIERISLAFKVSPEDFINPSQGGNVLNSPNSLNHIINDNEFVTKLINSKEETIEVQKELINQLKNTIALLSKK
jgi:transcriptional regulator with XRE-family HTH domain